MLTQENQRLNGAERLVLVLSILAIAALSFISKIETLPIHVPQIIRFASSPRITASVNHSFASYQRNTLLSNHKKDHRKIEQKKDNTDVIKKVPSAFADSNKIYQLINGKSFVVSRFGSATNGDSTDIIFVDGKRMTPDEVNSTIGKASIKSVGATAGEAAQRKYGLNQPVLELWLKPISETDNMSLSPDIEHKVLSKELDSIRVGQQQDLQNRLVTLLEWQKQKTEWKKQQALFEEQEKQFKKRSALFEEQARKFKENWSSTDSLNKKTIL